ncbi:EamA family transporter [Nocardia sp. CDC160]|uniref:EamA family transporter n=1 Tax=Nocardia sp. CDC160 TaxID=3112166 RepID=UPI002DB88E92|nr:EamA family transporter [Nocardia sp. CDC160]MEC3914698.1 EamA family transporter [Nocardia sp. CDC160]
MTKIVARSPVRARATGWSLISWTLFATSGPLAKAVMAAGWSPAEVTVARIGMAAGVLLPVVAVVRPQALKFRRGDLWTLGGYAALGVAGVQLLFFVAVQRVPIGLVMVLVNLAPVLVALWAQFVRRTRLPGQAWWGIGFAMAGLALVAQVWQGARLDVVGVAAALGAAICSAGYFLIGEYGATRHDPFGMTAAGLTIGATLLAVLTPPWSLPMNLLTTPVTLGNLRPPIWSALLVLAIAATVVPYLTGLYALRQLPASASATLALVEPLVAALLAWAFLGQALAPLQIVGAVIILIGATLVQLHLPEHQSD